MLSSLKKIFSSSNTKPVESDFDEETYFLCGLMVEAAYVDGKVDDEEIQKILTLLEEKFNQNSLENKKILDKCLNEINEHKSLHSFTSKFNKIFSEEKKLLLIETLWEIVLIDGNIHDFESNLIRRLAGLLYISDINCGNAKKRALSNLQNKNKQ